MARVIHLIIERRRVYCGENARWHDKGGGPFGVQFALWRLTRVARDAMRSAAGKAAGKACCTRAGEPMLTEMENIGDEPMRHPLLAAIGLVGVSALAVIFPSAASAQAQVALTGVVSSSEEPAMEGVLVSATKAGSNITVTVVTGADGRYSFPANRLGRL
jgi:hypothetical protein